MTFAEYTKEIHSVKNQIQKLMDDFYDQDNWYEIDNTEYLAELKKLTIKLETLEA